MAFTTVDMTPRIGTEVKIDKQALLDGSSAKDLRVLLEQRGVIFFRGHDLDDAEQVQLGRTLGIVREEHGLEVTAITADEKKSPIFYDYTKGTYFFHIDGTYTDKPGLASILNAKVLAPEGGQTEFGNTYAMYEDLSEEQQAYLDTLDTIHSSETIQRRAFPDPTEKQLALWGEGNNPPKQHPLVWLHESGRKSLLLSCGIKQVLGLSKADSDALIDKLLAHAEQPKYIYRHEWQVGDVLIWDNTGTMHRVVPFDLEAGRELHRVTLLGEEQIQAPPRTASQQQEMVTAH
jgi:alpha-ketoglutarate-dependent taurine dioxygenase